MKNAQDSSKIFPSGTQPSIEHKNGLTHKDLNFFFKDISFYVRYIVAVSSSLDDINAVTIVSLVSCILSIEPSYEFETIVLGYLNDLFENLCEYCLLVCEKGKEKDFFEHKLYLNTPILKSVFREADLRQLTWNFANKCGKIICHSRTFPTFSTSPFNEGHTSSRITLKLLTDHTGSDVQSNSFYATGVMKPQIIRDICSEKNHYDKILVDLRTIPKSVTSTPDKAGYLSFSLSTKSFGKGEISESVNNRGLKFDENSGCTNFNDASLSGFESDYVVSNEPSYHQLWDKSDLNAPVGVRFCSRTNRWVAQGVIDHQKHTKHFGVKRWGFKGAKKLAIRFRKRVEQLRMSKPTSKGNDSLSVFETTRESATTLSDKNNDATDADSQSISLDGALLSLIRKYSPSVDS